MTRRGKQTLTDRGGRACPYRAAFPPGSCRSVRELAYAGKIERNIQRGRIHIDHGFIGASDLDQGGKLTARLLTALVAPMLSGACTSEKKRAALKAKLRKKGAIGEGDASLAFADDFIDNMKTLHPKTISRQFYSDYVTPLADGIHADGTAVHIVYALKMGEKYGARYRRHFRDPDIHAFDMKHEVWLYDETWRQPVLDMIFACMEGSK